MTCVANGAAIADPAVFALAAGRCRRLGCVVRRNVLVAADIDDIEEPDSPCRSERSPGHTLRFVASAALGRLALQARGPGPVALENSSRASPHAQGDMPGMAGAE